MVKSMVILQIEDESNVYKIGDRVRVKMKPRDPSKPERANEYIGCIFGITKDAMTIHNSVLVRDLQIDNIDKMRFAKPDETFDNTWDF